MSDDLKHTFILVGETKEPRIVCSGHVCDWYDWSLASLLSEFAALRTEHQKCASVEEALARDSVSLAQTNARLLGEKMLLESDLRALREAALTLYVVCSPKRFPNPVDYQRVILLRNVLNKLALRGGGSGAGETEAIPPSANFREPSGKSRLNKDQVDASSIPAPAPHPELCECGHPKEEHEPECMEILSPFDRCSCRRYVPRQPPQGGE